MQNRKDCLVIPPSPIVPSIRIRWLTIPNGADGYNQENSRPTVPMALITIIRKIGAY
jgi:hypothetical protein